MTAALVDEGRIFNAARRIDDAAQRLAYVQQSCAGDTALASRVLALLRVHDEEPSFLASPPPEVGVATDNSLIEGPGSQIGPYKLLEQIGEGGFGVVFMAEQRQPIRRTVALKIIKPGMDSRQVIARFEAERQALALMDHPHIAHILDGGQTASGRPFFVMELVKGMPATRYCDENRLSPRERLILFVSVCEAVQHAHQKGIIHRDLKPMNVLVAAYDGKPIVKVIDFGVAKALGERRTERTLVTGFGGIIGTLEYMSPEQAEFNAKDVDTRADIYSLGVLLYELLTGTTPITRERIEEAGMSEALRLVREEQPPRPSTRLTALKQSLASISAQRRLDPSKLTKEVRGDLDWIVMKALEKDRNRRYATAGDLAEDVERYLRGEAIVARPPSAAYRLKIFARRHRNAVVTGAAVILALVGGTGLAVWQAIEATSAKNDALKAAAAEGAAKELALKAVAAETAAKDAAINAAAAETAAKETASAKEAETRSVLDFVDRRVFAAARPEGQSGGLGREVTLRKALEAALPAVDTSFADQPLVEARLRLTLGDSFLYLGEAGTAADQFRRAVALYTNHVGSDHADTLRATTKLANSYADLGRHAEAIGLYEQTLAAQKATLGPEQADSQYTMNYLGLSYQALGRYAHALKVHEELLSLRKAKLGPEHVETIYSMNNLAMAYYGLGRLTEAIQLNEEALVLKKRTLGPDHTDTLTGMQNLATSYLRTGNNAAALKLLEEARPALTNKLGSDHPYTLICSANLALCDMLMGKHADALKLLEEALSIQKTKLGRDHPDTLRTMINLATCYYRVGRQADALQLREETLPLQQAKLGPDHPQTLSTMNNLAVSYSTVGRKADALKLHEETLALRETKLGSDHPDTITSLGNVAKTLVALDRGAEAVSVMDECLQRAAGKQIRASLPEVADLRLRYFEKSQDAVGCRATAELWEKQQRNDAASLLEAARCRAVTGKMFRATPSAESAAEATLEDDRAMAWLQRAVAAGYKDAEVIKLDKDFESLRERDDFKTLISKLMASSAKAAN